MVIDLTPSVEMIINFMREGALTFMFVFAVTYFLLKKINLFGRSDGTGKEDSQKINIILALLLAIAAITPHFTSTYYGYGETVDVVEIVNNALPSVSLVIIAIVLFLILAAVFGAELDLPGGTMLSGIVIIGSLLTIIYIFLASAGIIVDWNFLYIIDEDLRNLIIIVVVMGLLIWFITSEPGDNNDDNWFEKFMKKLTKK